MMTRMNLLPVFLGALLTPSISLSSDACRPWGILTQAEVEVSDGTSFRTESVFQAVDAAAITHIREDGKTTIAVEGGDAWFMSGDNVGVGTEFHKLFALGHQYHALLLYFNDLIADIHTDRLEREGQSFDTRSGGYPYGGIVHLLSSVDAQSPWGFRFDFPNREPIWVRLESWSIQDGVQLPFVARIDDGEREFTYRYSDIVVNAGHGAWFQDSLAPPPLDAIQVHRLHRSLLAAHCDGDAQRIADLSAESSLSVNGGTVSSLTRDEMASRFSTLFSQLNYQTYADLQSPMIDIAESGDIAWAAVNVRARGQTADGEAQFDDQWAWIMLAKKVNGLWLHAGNASNRAPR